MFHLKENLEKIEERIQQACIKSGRSRSEVTLVAVSKGRTVDEMANLYSLGVRDFGENRISESLEKLSQLPIDINWHFIGALQSNKAKKIADNFAFIHSVDSISSCREIAKSSRAPQLFVQVNVGREVQKSGVFSEGLDKFLEDSLNFPSVRVTGLMTIGPQVNDPEESRSLFRNLAQLATQAGLSQLSMGMSDDFEVAIQEGATHVRVGSALFGQKIS